MRAGHQAITLCCIDTQEGRGAVRALQRSMGLPQVEAVLLFSADDTPVEQGITHVRIPHFTSVDEYSAFVLTQLRNYVTTSHALIVQWDGFVLNPARWSNMFFDFDYIGAVWPHFPKASSVGNGGFSLRSKKLLDALVHPSMDLHAPEDLCICHSNRRRLEDGFDIRFAPPEIAQLFSFERGPRADSLGFHGLFNFPIVFGDQLKEEIDQISLFRLCNRDAWDLAEQLLSSRYRGRWSVLGRVFWATLIHNPRGLLGLMRRWGRALLDRGQNQKKFS